MSANDDAKQYIWIANWKKFQHYKPRREQGPVWIKDYTAQLDDGVYLALTDRQRALLRDLRDMFAISRGRLVDDAPMIAGRRNSHTRDADLEVLNHAGLIDIVSRETLEQRLEDFYSSLKEVEEEEDITKAVEKGRSGQNGLKTRESINKKLRGTQ